MWSMVTIIRKGKDMETIIASVTELIIYEGIFNNYHKTYILDWAEKIRKHVLLDKIKTNNKAIQLLNIFTICLKINDIELDQITEKNFKYIKLEEFQQYLEYQLAIIKK